MDVIVLEDDLLFQDFYRFLTGREGHECRPEKLLRQLIAVAQRVPIIANVDFSAARFHNLDIRDVMGCPRLRRARRRTLSF